MVIEPLEDALAVCKVADYSQVNLEAEFCFTGKTDAERSLVCLESDVPSNATHVEAGWRGFRVAGQLDFSLMGILSEISTLMANAGIGIFALSTYDTDYVLVKAEDFERALSALSAAGHEVMRA